MEGSFWSVSAAVDSANVMSLSKMNKSMASLHLLDQNSVVNTLLLAPAVEIKQLYYWNCLDLQVSFPIN